MRPPAPGRIVFRLRALLEGAVAGWAMAMVFTLPMQFVKIAENATGSLKHLLWSCAAGSVVWALWSLAFIATASLCGGLPLLVVVREDWLLAHRRWSAGAAALLGWVVVSIKFDIWELLSPEHTLSVRIFSLYSLLFAISCGVATAVYLRAVARIRMLGLSADAAEAVGVNLG